MLRVVSLGDVQMDVTRYDTDADTMASMYYGELEDW